MPAGQMRERKRDDKNCCLMSLISVMKSFHQATYSVYLDTQHLFT